MKTL
jgi:hypothetical protein